MVTVYVPLLRGESLRRLIAASIGLIGKKLVSYGITVGRISYVPVTGMRAEFWLAVFGTMQTHIDFDGAVRRFQHEGLRRVEDPSDMSILIFHIHDGRAQ